MNRAIILLVIAVIFATERIGHAQTDTCSVLYPLYPVTVPYGTSSASPRDVFAGQTVGNGYGYLDNHNHALLWTATGTAVDLSPIGYTDSYAYGTNGTQQVGIGYKGTSESDALLWNGTAASAVDLNPATMIGSSAVGIDGAQQVGSGTVTLSGPAPIVHALLWNGTPGSAVDLNPSGDTESEANAVSASEQVGDASVIPYGPGSVAHAILWTGTAASAVDLNPAGFAVSVAYGTNGTQQVGFGEITTSAPDHALMWNSTSASAVDLNPTNLTGITNSRAYATNGTEQVGFGIGSTANSLDNAMVWFGTADSAFNLQSLLPASGEWQKSVAYNVDPSGNIYGVAYGSYDGISSSVFAIEWSVISPPPIPEPATVSLLPILFGGLVMRRSLRNIPSGSKSSPPI